MVYIGVIAHLLTFRLTSLDIQVFVTFSEAERVVVLMGSSAKTAEETVDFLRHQGEKAWYRGGGGGIFLGCGFKYVLFSSLFGEIRFHNTLRWSNMDNGPGLKMYFPLKMGIFNCYVSLP